MTQAGENNVAWLVGGGEMGDRIRSFDWSPTSLGARETWSQSLRSMLNMALANNFPMCIFWGSEYIQIYNDALIPIAGGNHPEMLGKPYAQTWAEVWEFVKPLFEQVRNSRQALTLEDQLYSVYRHGYLEEIYCLSSFSPLWDDSGEVAGILVTQTETTSKVISRRRMQTLRDLAARASEARSPQVACQMAAEVLADNSFDIPFALLYLLDANGQRAQLAAWVNLEADTAASPVEIDLTKQQPVWSLGNAAKKKQVDDLQQQFGDLPGGHWSESPTTAVVLPLEAQTDEERPAGFLVAGISPRRALDDDYREFLNLVAGQVSKAIANARAYEVERKRAEALAALDRAKTTFFSNISHELRTPLTLMLSPLETALRRLDDRLQPVEREELQMVQRNSLRLLKLVNTLLDFSRLEVGRVQATYEPTDLAQFTAELASVFRSAIEHAGLSLRVNCPPLPEPIYIDREMWEKIVLNLLSNAFKFTLEGSINVALQWQQTQVELRVADTGTGIPASELPRLFERFYRVENARGRTFEGSGIGLALVQELVKLHGGNITVTSTVNQGSVFIVTIPTGSTHLPSERINTTTELTSTAKSAVFYVEEARRWLPEEIGRVGEWESGGGREFTPSPPHPLTPSPFPARILLVDDNADMRDYIKRLLSDRDASPLGIRYEVQAVSNGVAALAAIEHSLPDLVLTDVMMPEMDGLELLQALRTNPQTRELPIILLSARAEEEARVEGLELGADDYLIKPFAARELLARVNSSLQLGWMRREAMQKRMRNILESITDGFVAIDRDWRYIYVNQKAEAQLHKQRAELIGKTLWEVFPELLNSPFEVGFRTAIAEQIAVDIEAFYPPFNTWFEVHCYPLEEGLSIYFRDVRDRKQAEAVLRESEERFRNMADNVPMMVWVTDATGYCTYLSQSWYNFTGQTEATGLGFGWLDATHPEDLEYAKSVFLAANDRHEAFRLEYRLRDKNGKYHFCIDAASPWFAEDGQFKGYIGSVIDITDRKQIEAEREQLLQQEQAAREAAEEANRIKDEFLAVLSHELRSPLNPILGWSKLLQTGKLDEARAKQALTTIERNAKLQSELIEDLLDVSRILRGKLSLTVSAINLASIVKAASETVRLAAEAKSIRIEAMLNSKVGLVLGDSTRLQQVVWNLLSNAVKFTPAGGRVEVRLEQVDNQAQITVSDTGKGIPPNFLPYVFDYFRQADSATTRKFGGLGVSLAIVRHLVELHGGRIQADSPGENLGATFTVILPLMPTQPTVNQNSQLSEPSLDLSGIQVLVVDDNTDTRDFIGFLLEQAGANVIAAASAVEAFTALTQSQPDVLLSDIGMPEMDGYMLMQQVRALPPEQGGQIRAIALTAYAGEFDYQQAMAVGFQMHISKPVEPEVLVQAIARVYGRNRGKGT